ncbi:glutamyl-tRNA synthetase [Chitinophaga costaii]|uniref:Glutamyl-tRNA synthetase n=1 Tax=Chitinophaga costaii TaxID=1335309 RepID=A0A1C4G8M5_9BACT|nr:glutamate--tRNA ligase family protein [Chitinophaga costaii]PUZ19429.1 tRNA glutamyl-Q synthetase [Chitinophaga costaii]SCC64111.1 glutamyl-tRNA synthetase [Chitinophaga costaii]
MQSPTFHRTRLAPTPSGYLHIGNALSFALTASLARYYGAHTLLRIDDMDRERVQPAYIQDIFDTLHFLNIPWNEGPQNATAYQQHFSQLKRLSYYNEALEKLVAQDMVYACTCSRAQILRQRADGSYAGTCQAKHLPLDTPNAAWRLRTDLTPLQVKTLEQGTITAPLPATMQHFVVRKKDGYPAYQLASLVDDQHFGVDLIVRGKDLWDATLAQQYLASVLNATSFINATFYHHPLLLEPDGQKLSKSAGATSIHYQRTQGHTAETVYKMISAALRLHTPATHWTSLGKLVLPATHAL